MIATYYQYNQLSRELEFIIGRLNDLRYRYYASELLDTLLHSRDYNIESAIRKAIAIMRITGLPVEKHFRRVYRSDIQGITGDWRLSELACGLIILSFDSGNKDVYEVQQIFLKHIGL